MLVRGSFNQINNFYCCEGRTKRNDEKIQIKSPISVKITSLVLKTNICSLCMAKPGDSCLFSMKHLSSSSSLFGWLVSHFEMMPRAPFLPNL